MIRQTVMDIVAASILEHTKIYLNSKINGGISTAVQVEGIV